MRDFDRDFNFISTAVKVIFVIVFVLIFAQIGFAIWLGVEAVDSVQNGTGLKELVETVWCGANNGQGVDCVKE